MSWDWGKTFLLLAVCTAAGVSFCSDQLDPYALLIIINIGISITLATSLNLVVGYAGQFSLGHAGFMAVGAYTSAIITTLWGPKLMATLGAPSSVLFLVATVVGGLLAAAAGFLVGVPSLRLRGDYLAIVTLGFGEIIRVIFQNWNYVGASRGFTSIPSYTTVFWAYLAAAICVYVISNLVNSTYGRGFLATRDDEIAAEAMGVNTTKYKVTAFVVGAFFAGVAGSLYGHAAGHLHPERFNFMVSVEILIIVILGGLGNTFGVVTAAILLTLLTEWLRDFREFSDYRMVVYSLLLIVLMIIRPQGLLGGLDPAKWWRTRGARGS